MEPDKTLLEIWHKYKWTILLAFFGLIFAVCVITYGFFKSLFLFLCIAAGIFIGLQIDKKTAKKRQSEDSYYQE